MLSNCEEQKEMWLLAHVSTFKLAAAAAAAAVGRSTQKDLNKVQRMNSYSNRLLQ